MKETLLDIAALMDFVKTLLKAWNDKVSKAVEAGKLNEEIPIPGTGLKLKIGDVFSLELNEQVDDFLTGVSGPVSVVAAFAKQDKPPLDKLTQLVGKAKGATLMASTAFITTISKWAIEPKVAAVKTATGIDFHVSEIQAKVNKVKSTSITAINPKPTKTNADFFRLATVPPPTAVGGDRPCCVVS